uniref:Uncharacterized protein n=1 Tax=Ditylum brightwellii TaxID=49249 RepID=A0A7S2A3E7_9STRA|mmetsp:Transcript_7919/g.11807  ORF Transcript_7919/g.11807 Transcript_7919/m.11807 type:complete len:284 (+) Transcript_7919:209-1060(+)
MLNTKPIEEATTLLPPSSAASHHTMVLNLTPIQTCAAVALVCSIWNLFGDICFIDFYLAHMNFDAFGAIDNVSRPGNLFDFDKDWPLLVAQAGGWMYPVWAMATIYPLYLGLETSGGATSDRRHSVLPCALLAYGLCVVGGNLHSGFAFTTILPQVFHKHTPQSDEHELNLHSTINFAQSTIMDRYVFGYTPGPLTIMIASGWIIYIVITKETKFPKWFALCTPLVTVAWVNLIGFMLMPWPWGMYFVGSFGTWIIFVMNAAASWVLWNVKAGITLQVQNHSV